jgi:2-isopropylmalate synthase
MALRVKRDLLGAATGIQTAELGATSRLVEELTGYVVPRNKAIVGRNAFAHESGIHQDGMLKDPRTYQIIEPAEVGALMSLPLGKHSGRHAFARACADAGLELDAAEISAAFLRFKTLADKHGADVPLAHVFQEVPAA